MKKTIFSFVIVFLSHVCSAQHVLAQVAKYYFRINPFTQTIGQFLQQLINDPTLINQSILKRTDTTLFYLSGDYKYFSPFFFKPDRTHTVLAESEMVLNDSLKLIDTIMVYQIAGYTEGSKEGQKEVKQEFERFDRKYFRKFPRNDFKELKSGGIVYGAIRNYYLNFSYLSPLSVAWQQTGPGRENVFVITLRFKIRGDVAVLPITSDSP